MRRIYMDHAATTYLHPRVKKAMDKFLIKEFGNPSSIYKEGRDAKRAINVARSEIAKIIGAQSDEIIFTSGGTESDNLAIFGAVGGALNFLDSLQLYPKGSDADSESKKFKAPKKVDSDADSESRKSKLENSLENLFSKNRILDVNTPHIITTKFEHHAVLNPCEFLEKKGFDVTYLDVNEDGIIKPEDVKKALRPDTIVVSIMYANNEIGTTQPIAEISEIISEFKKTSRPSSNRNFQFPLFHTDACQAGEYLDLNVDKLGVDLLTANGSKIYGPKGIGFLYVRRGISIQPMFYGGGQEKGIRSGTENVPVIIGMSEALKIAQKNKKKESKRLIVLRDYFIKRLLSEIPKTYLNGHHNKRLPNNINISVLGVEGESVLLRLDQKGIACSTGSACTSESLEPSHVLMALCRPQEYGHGSLRFTLGRANTKKDVDYVMKILPDIIKELRSFSAVRV